MALGWMVVNINRYHLSSTKPEVHIPIQVIGDFRLFRVINETNMFTLLLHKLYSAPLAKPQLQRQIIITLLLLQ